MIINLTYGTMLDLVGKRKKKKGTCSTPSKYWTLNTPKFLEFVLTKAKSQSSSRKILSNSGAC